MSTDFNGKNYSDQFIGSLVSYVAADSFQRQFEKFFVDHAEQINDEEEHQLKYYELYQKFHDMFENQLEDFCREKGLSQAEFMSQCRESVIEDPKAKHYIDILIGSVEYETFIKLMRFMKPVVQARNQLRADSKSPHSDLNSISKASKSELDSDSKGSRELADECDSKTDGPETSSSKGSK